MNILAPTTSLLCFAVAYRLWVAYKAERLRQRVYRMIRGHG